MNKYALDSNHIIPYTKGDMRMKRLIQSHITQGSQVYVPPFAYYEVRRGILKRGAYQQAKLLNELLKDCPLGRTTNEVFEVASAVYVELDAKGLHTEDDNDIYIAAFCKTFGLTLVTNNTRHFEQIDGLSHEDWTLEDTTAL
jgi:predicted nucleic acid-binding protein